jgi:hypothetical protein
MARLELKGQGPPCVSFDWLSDGAPTTRAWRAMSSMSDEACGSKRIMCGGLRSKNRNRIDKQ